MIKKKPVPQGSSPTKTNKVGQGLLRLQNDIKNFKQRNKENKQLTNVSLQFPIQKSPNPVHIIITPKIGFYQHSKITFVYNIPQQYPYKAPIVQCKQRIFHPNIDPQGKAVCLSILRDRWQANNQLIQVIYGLYQIIQCLNHGDIQKPLDARAAQLLKSDPKKFQEVVQRTLKGQSFQGRSFDRLWCG